MKIKYFLILPIIVVLILLNVSSVRAQVFTDNLYFGLQNNSQVSQLQDFLTSQGLYTGPITGNFYFLTLNAVKAFQIKQGITPAAGYFGPMTRNEVNKIADVEVSASNSEAISEVGTSTPPVQASSTIQLQLDALLKQVSLLQQQLQIQQSNAQQIQGLQTQVQQQTQTLQQIQQNTAPTPTPTPTPSPSPVSQSNFSTTATLKVFRDSNSPPSSTFVSDATGNVTGVSVFAFDLKTDNDSAKIDQVVLQFSGSAIPTVAYLYDGGSLLQSASISASTGYATFTNMMNDFQVSPNSTKVITVKVDFVNAGNNPSPTLVTIAQTGAWTAYKSDGTVYTLSGSGTSDTFYVMKVAPTFALASANATYTAGTYAGATGTMTGTFTFNVTANGADIYLASSTLGAFQINLGGMTAAIVPNALVSYQDPTGYPQVSGYYDIPEGSTATFTVNATALHPGTAANVGSTYMYISGVTWNTLPQVSGQSTLTYMSTILKTPYVSVQ